MLKKHWFLARKFKLFDFELFRVLSFLNFYICYVFRIFYIIFVVEVDSNLNFPHFCNVFVTTAESQFWISVDEDRRILYLNLKKSEQKVSPCQKSQKKARIRPLETNMYVLLIFAPLRFLGFLYFLRFDFWRDLKWLLIFSIFELFNFFFAFSVFGHKN